MESYFVGKPAQIEFLLRADPPVTVTGVTLTGYDSTGAVITSLNGVTGAFTPATSATEIILSYGWASPVLGQVRGEWLVTYSGGATQTFLQEFQVVANPPSPGIATYDPTTLIGKVRIWANDRDVNNPIWSDAEINVFLTQMNSDPIDAAIGCLTAECANLSRQAILVGTPTQKTDLSKRVEAMHAQIEMLGELATTPPAGLSPTRVFIPAYDGGDPVTTMDPW